MTWKHPPRWAATRKAVFRLYGRQYWRCGGYANIVDHLVPQALGGSDDNLANLRPCCSRCDSSMGASMGNRLRAGTLQQPRWARSRDW